jgi:hypothetical protein
MRSKNPHPIVHKILQPLLVQLDNNLQKDTLTKKQIKIYETEISRVTLFTSLFQPELDALLEKSNEELSLIFRYLFF